MHAANELGLREDRMSGIRCPTLSDAGFRGPLVLKHHIAMIITIWPHPKIATKNFGRLPPCLPTFDGTLGNVAAFDSLAHIIHEDW